MTRSKQNEFRHFVMPALARGQGIYLRAYNLAIHKINITTREHDDMLHTAELFEWAAAELRKVAAGATIADVRDRPDIPAEKGQKRQ
jgi:hypothetical protein